MPRLSVWYFLSVRRRRPAANNSRRQTAICDAISRRAAIARRRPAVNPKLFARRTPETGERKAIHKGARPKPIATRVEVPSVNSSTLRSGSRPLSIPDQPARARVAKAAKIHPSVAPLVTKSELSTSNWRNKSNFSAPMASFRLNSRCRTSLRATSRSATFVQAINKTRSTSPIKTWTSSRYCWL